MPDAGGALRRVEDVMFAGAARSKDGDDEYVVRGVE